MQTIMVKWRRGKNVRLNVEKMTFYIIWPRQSKSGSKYQKMEKSFYLFWSKKW
jgi:hypothetical protein